MYFGEFHDVFLEAIDFAYFEAVHLGLLFFHDHTFSCHVQIVDDYCSELNTFSFLFLAFRFCFCFEFDVGLQSKRE